MSMLEIVDRVIALAALRCKFSTKSSQTVQVGACLARVTPSGDFNPPEGESIFTMSPNDSALRGYLVLQIAIVSPPERESSQLSGSLPIFRSRFSGGSP